MTSYTNIFTGNPIQTTPTSYRAVTLTADTTLSWTFNNEDNSNVVADLMEVTASASSLSILMPPANQAANGKATLVRNVGSNSFTVKSNTGATIQVIAAGQVFWVYVADNSTVAGTWKSFQFGTGTSSADANSLAGAGLYAVSSTLNLWFDSNSFASNTTLTTGYRATTAVWTGGAGTFSFPAAATLGDGWFILIKNGGTGALTLDPNGAELIDSASTVSLNPLESAIVVCTGTQFYTIGKSSSSTAPVFTRLVKSVAGGTDVTLTTTEAAYDIQEYTGLLTANINVIVPTTVGRWWVYNNTTGAFTLTVKTAAGTGIALAQGTRAIFHCDGTNVVRSVDTGSGTVTSVATGTGLSGGPVTTTGTISLANTAVVAGTYGSTAGNPSFVVDAQGRLTSATNDAGSAHVFVAAANVGGTATAITLTPTVAAASYVAGQRYRFPAAAAAAGATTINVSSLGAKNMFKKTSISPVSGDWGVGTILDVVYDGTSFQWLDGDNFSQLGDIASASTINLDSTTGNVVDVTGTTTITAITLAAGKEVTVRFTGALTLTNGASLVLPGGANITTAAGDYACFRGYAAGVVRCEYYSPANGAPVAIVPVSKGGTGTATPSIVAGTNISVTGTWPNQTVNSTAGVTQGTVITLSGATTVITVDFSTYYSYLLQFHGFTNSASQPVTITFSSDGGSTYASVAYRNYKIFSSTTFVTGSTTEFTSALTTGSSSIEGTAHITQNATNSNTMLTINASCESAVTTVGSSKHSTTAAVNRIKIDGGAGGLGGFIIITPISKR